MKKLLNLLMLVAAVLLVFLVFQNLGAVEIRLLFWKANLSVAALICLSGFLGMVSCPLLMRWFKGRWGHEVPGSATESTPPPTLG